MDLHSYNHVFYATYNEVDNVVDKTIKSGFYFCLLVIVVNGFLCWQEIGFSCLLFFVS